MYTDVDGGSIITTDINTLDDAIFNIDYIQRRLKYMYNDTYDE